MDVMTKLHFWDWSLLIDETIFYGYICCALDASQQITRTVKSIQGGYYNVVAQHLLCYCLYSLLFSFFARRLLDAMLCCVHIPVCAKDDSFCWFLYYSDVECRIFPLQGKKKMTISIDHDDHNTTTTSYLVHKILEKDKTGCSKISRRPKTTQIYK